MLDLLKMNRSSFMVTIGMRNPNIHNETSILVFETLRDLRVALQFEALQRFGSSTIWEHKKLHIEMKFVHVASTMNMFIFQGWGPGPWNCH